MKAGRIIAAFCISGMLAAGGAYPCMAEESAAEITKERVYELLDML